MTSECAALGFVCSARPVRMHPLNFIIMHKQISNNERTAQAPHTPHHTDPLNPTGLRSRCTLYFPFSPVHVFFKLFNMRVKLRVERLGEKQRIGMDYG